MVDEAGSSYLFTESLMERALKNLIDWNFMAFAKMSEKVTLMSRELTCRYGPEDIDYLYRECEEVPLIVKSIYGAK